VAGDKGRRCRFELQPHELLGAENVLQRFPLGPPGNQGTEGGKLIILERLVKVEIEADPVKGKRLAEQPLSLKTGILDTLSSKIPFGPGKDF
jgi:hypothetical protein